MGSIPQHSPGPTFPIPPPPPGSLDYATSKEDYLDNIFSGAASGGCRVQGQGEDQVRGQV